MLSEGGVGSGSAVSNISTPGDGRFVWVGFENQMAFAERKWKHLAIWLCTRLGGMFTSNQYTGRVRDQRLRSESRYRTSRWTHRKALLIRRELLIPQPRQVLHKSMGSTTRRGQRLL